MTTTTDVSALENAFRTIARALAPYIAAELQRIAPGREIPDALSADYDTRTCAVFVKELGTDVIDRAHGFFGSLAANGRIDALTLAEHLGSTSPRELPGLLTTPLKRRAQKLGLPLPFRGGMGGLPYGGIPEPRSGDDPGRTYWEDYNGIADRMVDALAAEYEARRSGERPEESGPEGKYAPLRRYLEGSHGDEAQLTFQELDRMVGGLPASARTRRPWWGNQTDTLGGHVQARAWMEAGWRAFPDLKAELVTFRRAK